MCVDKETKIEYLKVWFIIALVIGLGVSSLYYIGVNSRSDISYLKEKIDKMQNVTNDYRDGWNDAISALEDFRLNVNVVNVTK